MGALSSRQLLVAGLEMGVFRVKVFAALCIGFALLVFCAHGLGGAFCFFFDADGFGVVVLILFKILVVPDSLAEGSISRVARVEDHIVV